MKLNQKQLEKVTEKMEEKIIIKNIFDIYDNKEVYQDLNKEELIVLGMI